MHYLRCSSCGHLNEVKTEYLTFCKNCNKVLENNFQDWVKKNPGRSFDDYLQNVCTTETQGPEVKEAVKKNRLNYKFWIGFTLTFVLFYVVGQFAGDKIVTFFKKPAFDKVMLQISSELNKSCPLMVDKATRLDNTGVLPDKVFQYNYTIISVSRDSINIDEVKKIIEPRIINDVKTNPQMKYVRDNKVTVNYSYKDRNGVYLFMVSVTPDQYK